jgi:hypothetical protein
VLAVRANTTVTPSSGLTVTASGALKLIPDRAWQRLRTGSGTKGVRHYDWAMLAITADDPPDGQDDGHSVLLIRRHRYTRTVSFYRCWTSWHPLERDLPARLHLPRRHHRRLPQRHQPARRPLPDPRHHPRTGAHAPRRSHPAAPPRPASPSALVRLAAPPPVPGPAGSPALERLRLRDTIITNYSGRN